MKTAPDTDQHAVNVSCVGLSNKKGVHIAMIAVSQSLTMCRRLTAAYRRLTNKLPRTPNITRYQLLCKCCWKTLMAVSESTEPRHLLHTNDKTQLLLLQESCVLFLLETTMTLSCTKFSLDLFFGGRSLCKPHVFKPQRETLAYQSVSSGISFPYNKPE